MKYETTSANHVTPACYLLAPIVDPDTAVPHMANQSMASMSKDVALGDLEDIEPTVVQSQPLRK
jgi:hypothetical protein